MKKLSFILLAFVAMLTCGCEKDPSDTPGGNNPSVPTIDIKPYLGISTSLSTATWMLRPSP